jgi:hypothetical protein
MLPKQSKLSQKIGGIFAGTQELDVDFDALLDGGKCT